MSFLFILPGLITSLTKVKDKGMHNERRAFVRARGELPQVYYLQIKFTLFRDYCMVRAREHNQILVLL